MELPAQGPTDLGAVKLAQSIRAVESNGNFAAKGKSGEYGAYQFMPETWKAWAGKYLGDPNADITNPENQNKVAYAKIKDLKDQGYTPEQVASIWNSGKPDYQGNVGVNSKGVAFDTPKYVASVIDKFQQLKQGQQNGPTLPNPSQVQSPEQKSVGGFIGNIFSSAGGVVGGLANALFHPIQTLQGLGSIAAGGVEKLIPGQQADEQSFNNLVDFFKQRYGGIENIKNTIYKDPVGFALDLSTALGAGGAALGVAGKAGEIGSLTKAASIASKASELSDPLLAMGKLAGKTLSPITNASEVLPSRIMNQAIGATAKDVQIGKAPGEFLAEQGHFGTEGQLMKQFQGNADVLRAEILRKVAATPGDVITSDILASTRDALLNRYKGAYSAEHIDAAIQRAPVAGLLENKTLSFADANQLRESLGKVVGTKKFEATAEQSLANEVNQTLYRQLQEAIKPATGTTEEFAALSKYIKAIKRLETKMGRSEKYALNIGLKDIGFGGLGTLAGGPAGGLGAIAAERIAKSTATKTLIAQALRQSDRALKLVSNSKYAKALVKARLPLAQAGKIVSATNQK